jgi:hypothetical protein
MGFNSVFKGLILALDKCEWWALCPAYFYEELEQFFYSFPKYYMKILLGDFNVKLGTEDIWKPTTCSESLHQNSKDNSVRIESFATSIPNC